MTPDFDKPAEEVWTFQYPDRLPTSIKEPPPRPPPRTRSSSWKSGGASVFFICTYFCQRERLSPFCPRRILRRLIGRGTPFLHRFLNESIPLPARRALPHPFCGLISAFFAKKKRFVLPSSFLLKRGQGSGLKQPQIPSP